MLTKEDYLQAVRSLFRRNEVCHESLKAKHRLEELINEHFDNLPLKFEEIELGKWYWDNKLKDYIYIDGRFGENCFEYRASHGSGVRRFEENRFYRREVKE